MMSRPPRAKSSKRYCHKKDPATLNGASGLSLFTRAIR
jgi:hypothetical protein